MKTIRHNTYETNSSSTHSITIDTANYKNVQIPKTLTIPLGTFGWEHRKFNDFLNKASYFWTLAEYDNDLKDRMIRIAADHELDLEFSTSKDDFFYVDHGTEHYSNWIKKHPELLTDEGLWNFLINESCWIVLGNDNECEHANWRITEKAAKAMPFQAYVLACDHDDYIPYDFAMFKTDKETVAENKQVITEHVHYILENERDERKWDDPYPCIADVSDEGIVTIEYQKWDHSAKKHDIIHTRKLRVEIEKAKKS